MPRGPLKSARFEPIDWQIAGRVLSTADHTLVMGILNVTPDSFSDGGDYIDPGLAVTHGLELWNEGADIVDVGGESTRPGAAAVPTEEELRRVTPVISELAAAGVVVSVDTSKAEVAAAAIEAGAAIVNDVTALGDPGVARVVAESGAGVVLMHMLGSPRTMQSEPEYADVVAEIRDYLEARASVAEAAGIDRAQICIDPGIGFGKTVDHNLALLRNVDAFVAGGRPVMIGASRKSFLSALIGDPGLRGRDEATGASIALSIAGGAAVVRVHNVVVAQRIARVADAIVRARTKHEG